MESVNLSLAEEALCPSPARRLSARPGHARLALDHGEHFARHHVRYAEPRRRQGSGDFETSRGGNRAASVCLRGSLGSYWRRQRLRPICQTCDRGQRHREFCGVSRFERLLVSGPSFLSCLILVAVIAR
jgi:hypothetical protein